MDNDSPQQQPTDNEFSSLWDGNTYRNNSSIQFELAQEVLTYSFNGAENVLDLGCGDGKISAMLAIEKVPQGSVVGLDISHSMIAAAKEDFLHKKIGNLQFAVADMQSFKVNQVFDLIVSFNSMHWVSDHIAIWKNIHAHLNPGGKVFVSTNPPPRMEELTATIDYMQTSQNLVSVLKDF